MNRKTTEAFAGDLVRHVRAEFGTDDFIPLHAPSFGAVEREMVLETLETGFVSSVGRHVGDFEQAIADYTGASYAIATVNGTAALHACLVLAGVQPGDEVITQSLTFVATCNAIRYCRADPVLVDVDESTLGMSPDSLSQWLEENAEIRDDGQCRNRRTGKVIRACVPMHCFGHPARIDRIVEVCESWRIFLIEDAAESLGSFFRGRHTGRHGRLAAISFNGNKIITTGGGGMIITDDEDLAARARHLTTTAKKPHPWLYIHDEGRVQLPVAGDQCGAGLCADAGVAGRVERKRALAQRYEQWFGQTGYEFFHEPPETESNYWFNAFFATDRAERDLILELTNSAGVMTRPCWTPMHQLALYEECTRSDLSVTEALENRLVAIPSSAV